MTEQDLLNELVKIHTENQQLKEENEEYSHRWTKCLQLAVDFQTLEKENESLRQLKPRIEEQIKEMKKQIELANTALNETPNSDIILDRNVMQYHLVGLEQLLNEQPNYTGVGN